MDAEQCFKMEIITLLKYIFTSVYSIVLLLFYIAVHWLGPCVINKVCTKIYVVAVHRLNDSTVLYFTFQALTYDRCVIIIINYSMTLTGQTSFVQLLINFNNLIDAYTYLYTTSIVRLSQL